MEHTRGSVALAATFTTHGDQKRLAARLGKNQATISRVARGERYPSRELIADIARETGIPVAWWYEPASDDACVRQAA